MKNMFLNIKIPGQNRRNIVDITKTDFFIEEFFVKSQREGQVDNDEIVDGKSAEHPDQKVHRFAFERVLTEPYRISLFVFLEHSEFRIQNLFEEQHEKLLLHSACVFCFFVVELDLKSNFNL